MRLVSDVDWTELVESVSLVDDVLQSGSDFASMDFPTRNLYRSAIEELARGSKLTELEIARAALVAAADPKHQACQTGDGIASRERAPGYHLIAGGRPTFERTIGFRAPMRDWLVRSRTKIGIGGYVGSVIIRHGDRSASAVDRAGGAADRRLVAGSLGAPRTDPVDGSGGRNREPGRDERVRSDDLAGLGTPRWRDGEPAHDGCRPDPADDAGRARRANRTSGDPLPCESGRRPSFRASFGLDGRLDRARRGR